MLKKLWLWIVVFFWFNNFVWGQKEANIWMIEKGNGIDFSNDTAVFFNGCQLRDNETSSSICDSNGNLLFYTNGIVVYNKYHKLVKNGTGLGFPISNIESSSFQGSLILKHPQNDSLLYIFSSDFIGQQGGLVYSILNIKGNYDSGIVIKKKFRLI